MNKRLKKKLRNKKVTVETLVLKIDDVNYNNRIYVSNGQNEALIQVMNNIKNIIANECVKHVYDFSYKDNDDELMKQIIGE